MCKAVGWGWGQMGDRLLGLRKSLSPLDQFRLVFQGDKVQGGLGQGQGMFQGAPGEGAGGVYSLTRALLCLPCTGSPHSGPVSGELPREQKLREEKGEEGDTLAGTEPGRKGGGGGAEGAPVPSRKGREGGGAELRWAPLADLTPTQFNKEGHGRLENRRWPSLDRAK